MSHPDRLRARNRDWAARRRQRDPQLFARLARAQSPSVLWIGCSDSRVPPTLITDTDPGELFVHRNVANLVPEGDASAGTALAFAVSVLQVEHVIVCGHYGCGGVEAALDGRSHGPLDPWLAHLRAVAASHEQELAALPDGATRVARLAELNAVEQARAVSRMDPVHRAWAQGRPLSVRAWMYDIGEGLLHELEVVVTGAGEAGAGHG